MKCVLCNNEIIDTEYELIEDYEEPLTKEEKKEITKLLTK